MADNAIVSKLADIPLARPGFDTLGISAPLIVQMNPNGKWETSEPNNLDEASLRAIVQRLISTKALSAAHSYCRHCLAENKTAGTPPSKYIPVVMMPILPADQCPFDMDCEIQKMKDAEKTKPTKHTKAQTKVVKEDDREKKRFSKPRGYVLQRLTDFDLLSQW